MLLSTDGAVGCHMAFGFALCVIISLLVYRMIPWLVIVNFGFILATETVPFESRNEEGKTSA